MSKLEAYAATLGFLSGISLGTHIALGCFYYINPSHMAIASLSLAFITIVFLLAWQDKETSNV